VPVSDLHLGGTGATQYGAMFLFGRPPHSRDPAGDPIANATQGAHAGADWRTHARLFLVANQRVDSVLYIVLKRFFEVSNLLVL